MSGRQDDADVNVHMCMDGGYKKFVVTAGNRFLKSGVGWR